MRYPLKGDAARLIHNHAVQLNSLRVQRPRNSHVMTLNWEKEGDITLDRVFGPAKVSIDPRVTGKVPEYKEVVAQDGWVQGGGPVIISFKSNDGYFFEDFSIEGSSNYLELDPPFVVQNGIFKGEFIQPELQAEPEFPAFTLVVMVTIETSPI